MAKVKDAARDFVVVVMDDVTNGLNVSFIRVSRHGHDGLAWSIKLIFVQMMLIYDNWFTTLGLRRSMFMKQMAYDGGSLKESTGSPTSNVRNDRVHVFEKIVQMPDYNSY